MLKILFRLLNLLKKVLISYEVLENQHFYLNNIEDSGFFNLTIFVISYFSLFHYLFFHLGSLHILSI